MAITREQLENELESRRNAMLAAVGIAKTPTGFAEMNSPIGYAIRQCGGTVANFSSVADSDLATVDPADYDKLMDLAEYRLLINIKGNWGRVDFTSGPFSQSLSQFAEQLDKDIELIKEQLENVHGIGGSSLQVGVIDFNFMQSDPDASL